MSLTDLLYDNLELVSCKHLLCYVLSEIELNSQTVI
jgi:hypothetical protein